MLFTADDGAPRNSLETFIAREINPFVDVWEEEGIFPAKALFKKLGNAGFLGINKPEALGGSGLDYSFGLTTAETLDTGVPMGSEPAQTADRTVRRAACPRLGISSWAFAMKWF